MLPLRVAHARTGHSSQGITAHNGVVVLPGSKFFGGDYVAISRGKRIEDIWLLKPIRATNFSVENAFRIKKVYNENKHTIIL
jgi:ATP-dependent exoDNAse (exonuclease V) alpha subunit